MGLSHENPSSFYPLPLDSRNLSVIENRAHEEQESSSGLKIAVYRPPHALTNEVIEKWGVYTKSGPLTSKRIMDLVGTERRYIVTGQENVVTMGNAVLRASQVSDNLRYFGASTSHPLGINLSSTLLRSVNLNPENIEHCDYHFACSGFVEMLVDAHAKEKELEGEEVAFVTSEVYSHTLVNLDEPGAIERDPSLAQTIFSDGAVAMAGVYGVDFRILASKSINMSNELAHLIKMRVDPRLMVMPYKDHPVPYSYDFYQDGRGVHDAMESTVPKEIVNIMEEANLTPNDIDAIIPHQGSKHMIRAIQIRLKRMGLSEKVVFDNEEGNFSSGSIPKTLGKLIEEGKIKKGKIILAAFGGGPHGAMAAMEVAA